MRRIAVAAAVAAALSCWTAAAASAETPLTVGASAGSTSTSVAVNNDGSAVVAWAASGTPDTVKWCLLPAGGTACTATGSLAPAGSAQYVDKVQVLNEGSSVVILADVFASSATTYENVQEWQSTNNGQSFTAVDGGLAVASGNPSSDTFAIDGVTLPGGNAIGVGFDTASAQPTFHALSVTSPTSCGRATNQCADGYATLEPASNPDVISNPPDGANFVSNNDGVLGVYFTNFASGPLSCPGSLTSQFGTAFVFGDGKQTASNNYNVSPGQPDSAWRVAATQADCNIDYPAVGGGPSGFGVVEDDLATGQTVYHHFDGINNTFATTQPVVISGNKEQQASVSQDGAGGVYAIDLDGGIGGPVSLNYSYDGGTTWTGPATIAADPAGEISGLTSSVGTSGQGWATWEENGSVFAEPFVAADAVPPAQPVTLTTSQTSGTTTGASITVPAGTVGESDTAILAGANVASASGTVTYGLYSSPTCTPDSAIAQSTSPVSAGVAAASSPVTVALASGTYYWQASYSGNAGNALGVKGNLPASSACGAELLTVAAATPPATTGTDPVSIGSGATSDGTTVNVNVSCATFPCTVTLTLTGSETVIVKAHALRADATKRKTKKVTKTITLGKGTFTLKRRSTLKIKLSKTGRAYLAKRNGKVKLQLAVGQKTGSSTKVTKHALTVKVTHPNKAKPKKNH